jgi:hypothetical protein
MRKALVKVTALVACLALIGLTASAAVKFDQRTEPRRVSDRVMQPADVVLTYFSFGPAIYADEIFDQIDPVKIRIAGGLTGGRPSGGD